MVVLGRRDQACDGSSLVGLLVVLIVLGGLAVVIPLATMNANTGTRIGSSSSSPGAGSAVPAAGGVTNATAAATCRSEYSAAEQAVAQYQLENGSLPVRIEDVQALLRDPLSTAQFTITIDPQRPGRLQVATSKQPAADGPANCAYAS